MIRRIVSLALLCSFSLTPTIVMAGGGGDLWKLADHGKSIKVFIGNFGNESGKNEVTAEGLKNTIAKALLNRKSVKFELVNAPEQSDVEISAVIKKYLYMERGPFKPSPSIGTTLLDAAATMTENYVEMTVNFIVTKSGTGEVLWKDSLMPYAKKKMTPVESIQHIYDKVAGHFVWKCFGKPNA